MRWCAIRSKGAPTTALRYASTNRNETAAHASNFSLVSSMWLCVLYLYLRCEFYHTILTWIHFQLLQFILLVSCKLICLSTNIVMVSSRSLSSSGPGPQSRCGPGPNVRLECTRVLRVAEASSRGSRAPALVCVLRFLQQDSSFTSSRHQKETLLLPTSIIDSIVCRTGLNRGFVSKEVEGDLLATERLLEAEVEVELEKESIVKRVWKWAFESTGSSGSLRDSLALMSNSERYKSSNTTNSSLLSGVGSYQNLI